MAIVSQMLAMVCSHGLGLICLGLFFYRWQNYWWFVLHMQLDMEDGDEIDAMLHQTGGMALWPQVYFGRHYGSGILLYVMPSSNVFCGLFYVRNCGNGKPRFWRLLLQSTHKQMEFVPRSFFRGGSLLMLKGGSHLWSLGWGFINCVQHLLSFWITQANSPCLVHMQFDMPSI